MHKPLWVEIRFKMTFHFQLKILDFMVDSMWDHLRILSREPTWPYLQDYNPI